MSEVIVYPPLDITDPSPENNGENAGLPAVSYDYSPHLLESTFSHPTPNDCALTAYPPKRIGTAEGWIMRGEAYNHCFGGRGVAYMETHVSLQLRRPSGTGWNNLDHAWLSKEFAGELKPRAEYPCKHSQTKAYRVQGLAYTDIRGRGWVAANRRTNDRTCPV